MNQEIQQAGFCDLERCPNVSHSRVKSVARSQFDLVCHHPRSKVAMFKTARDPRVKNTGDYHNPTRQRGISPDTAFNTKAQSLTYVSGCDERKFGTSKHAR